MNSVRLNNLSLKYQRFTSSGFKDIGIIKLSLRQRLNSFKVNLIFCICYFMILCILIINILNIFMIYFFYNFYQNEMVRLIFSNVHRFLRLHVRRFSFSCFPLTVQLWRCFYKNVYESLSLRLYMTVNDHPFIEYMSPSLFFICFA